MQLLDDAKLITCFLPKGRASAIERLVIERFGLRSANFHHARGVGRFTPLAARGIGEQQEKQILEISVPAGIADEVFEVIFTEGDMNRPHGGILFVTRLVRASRMELPELPPEA